MIETKESVRMFYDGRNLSSIEPCYSLFGYTYWSYLIPPFRPERVLVLGAGIGSVSKLLWKVFDEDLHITEIDLEYRDGDGFFSGQCYKQDAKEFLLETCEKWDYIVVDLFDRHGTIPMVFSKDFVELVKSRCSRMVGLNCFVGDRERSRVWAESFSVEAMSVVQGNLIYKLRLPELPHTMQSTFDGADKVGLDPQLEVI